MMKSFSVRMKTENAFELASGISTSTGLLRELYSDKTPEGLSRYENVQELLNGIREFVDTGRSITPKSDEEINQDPDALRSLDQFMQDIALLTDADDDDPENNDKVSLMTIHAAKGLEFPAVYIVGLEENLFPSQMSMDSREDLEEERRLFYVAITRAEKKLTISFANSRYKWGNLINCEPSRFIEEIDPDYVEEIGGQTHKHHGNLFYDQHMDERWDPRTVKKETIASRAKPAPHLKKIESSEVDNFISDDAAAIQAGMQVEHQRFGPGKVLLVEGNASDLKATVFFQGFGQKQLLLKYAKLKIIG